MAVLTPRVAVRNGVVALGFKSTSTGFSAANSSQWSGYLGQTRIVAFTTGSTVAPSTAAATHYCDTLIPRDEKIGFLVSLWASSTAVTETTISVAQGSEGRAWQRSLGQFDVSVTCTRAGGAGYQYFLGPFESARFAYESTDESDAIRIWLSASSSGESAMATVEAFRMPSVTYST